MLATKDEYPSTTFWGLLLRRLNRNIEGDAATVRVGLTMIAGLATVLALALWRLPPTAGISLVIASVTAILTVVGFVQDGIRLHQLLTTSLLVYALVGEAADPSASGSVKIAGGLFLLCAVVLCVSTRRKGDVLAKRRTEPTPGVVYPYDRIPSGSDPLDAFYDALNIREGLGARVELKPKPPRLEISSRQG